MTRDAHIDTRSDPSPSELPVGESSASVSHTLALGTRERRSRGISTEGASGELVQIELSQAQVDQVVRAASDAGSMSLLLTGLGESREALERAARQVGSADSNLSSSLLCGLLVLAAFPADGSSVGNAEVARTMGMNPSTAHRYITTLVVAGLLEKDSGTRRYRLAR